MNRFLQFIPIILLALCHHHGHTQGITSNWIMGYGTNIAERSLLNFGSGNLTVSQFIYPMQYRSTNTTISDNSGNLLFSVNGFYIADASGDTMQNGSGLNPSVYTSMFEDGLSLMQANLALQKPGSDSIYYLFHSTIDILATSQAQYLYLTTIDMNGNGGLGSVISKNHILISNLLNVGKLTACKHANGRDWWVISKKSNSNDFYMLLVTPYGINGPYTQTIGIVRTNDSGQVVFSPDGTKFAYYWPLNDLEIFNFDRCTGLLSNPLHIVFNDSASAGGVAFSPNSEVLYVSSTKYVYQFDVTAANIPATKQTVAVWDGFYSPFPPLATLFTLSQLASDGKIYITTGNGGLHIHIINQPDSLGAACDLIQHGIQIPFYYFNTLPNHPNYFLGSESGSVCDSLNWTGVNQTPESITLSVFPNPATDQVAFSFTPSKDTGTLLIFDITGKQLLRKQISPWSQYLKIDINDLNAGLYFVKIRWGNREADTKMIKLE